MSNPDRPARRWRRGRALLLGLALAGIALELVLQVAAFVLWAVSRSEPRPEGRVVLCLGDSLTFGLGTAPAQAYPQRLEAILRQRGTQCSVVNAGIPGQDSADVVSRLAPLLARYRPEVLCLLVGWNDTWSRPAALARDEVHAHGFPWRWRTARLLELALARWRPAHTDAAPMPFVGTWHVRGQSLQFAADGTARLGGLPATWTLAGENLQITPAGGSPFLVRWRESEGGIDFALFGWDRFYRARRGLQHDDLPPEFDEALELGAIDQALGILAASRGAATELAMQAQLCLVLLRAGRREESLALWRGLDGEWQQRRTPVAGEAVARWHAETGDHAAALAVADAVVMLAPDRVACWRVLVDRGPPAGRRALAARIEAAAAVQASSWRRAELTAEQAVLTATWDTDAAVGTLLAARRLGIGPDETIAAMRRAVALGADPARLLAAVPRLDAPPAAREALERDVRRATVTDTEMLAILDAHVRLAVELCRAQSTELVLLGYPFAMQQHEAAMQQIAATERVPFVSMVAPFAGKLADSARSDWFADEIHCTARGYELMASLVADRIAAIWR